MAGDWIKVEAATPNKREILRMARTLGLSRDDVVGKVIRFWIWADANTVDGHVDGLASTDVDALVEHPGFAAALEDVGWLGCDDGNEILTIPSFDRHQGDSAKNRALRNERQARYRRSRNGNVDAGVDTGPSTGASTREENRRSINTPQPPSSEGGSSKDKSEQGSRSAGTNPRQQGTNPRSVNGVDSDTIVERWSRLVWHCRQGHRILDVTEDDPVLAEAAKGLGGMTRLKRLNEQDLERERGKFASLYRQAQQETGT